MNLKSWFCFSVMIIAFLTMNAQPKVIAHRGYWKCEGSAQNSLAALQKSSELKVWGSEFDVLMTVDGKLVVNHDDCIDGYRIETTKYEKIKDKKLKNGETLPLLEQYLTAGKKCPDLILVLEIKPHKNKRHEAKAVERIVRMVQDMRMEEQVHYISFSLDACKELVKLVPHAEIAYLEGDLSPKEIKKLGMTGIDYHYKIIEKHPEWVQEAHDLGMTVNVWTVNGTDDLKRMIRFGVDFVTTDNPAVALQLADSDI